MLTLSRLVNRLCEGVAIALLVLMLGLVLVQVAGRYLLDAPPSWTEESARLAMVWIAFLGSTSAFYRRTDPRMSINVVEKSVWLDKIRHAGRAIAVIVFLGPLVVFAPGFLERHFFRTTETLHLNSAFVVIVAPLAGLIVLLHLMAQLIGKRDGPERGQSPGTPL